MVRTASLLPGLVLLTVACMPVMYAIRTLIGMKRKEVYPLLRIRQCDGSNLPVTTMGTSREFLGILQDNGRWQLKSRC